MDFTRIAILTLFWVLFWVLILGVAIVVVELGVRWGGI